MSILNTTTPEASARLVRKDKDMSAYGFTLIRTWTHLHAAYADDLAVALDAVATYSNPYADGQAYTGTFTNSRVWASSSFNDPETGERYVNIYQQLILTTTPASIANLAALTAEVTQDNKVDNIFSDYTSTIKGTGDLYDLILTYRNLTTSARAYCMGEAGTNLVSLIVSGDFPAWATSTAYVVGNVVISSTIRYICTTAHTSGTFATDLAAGKWTALSDWTYADRKFVTEDNNTGTFSILFRRARYQTDATANSAIVFTIKDAVGKERAEVLRVWLRRSYAAMVTLTTVSTGVARTSATIDGTSFTHLSCDKNEGPDGSWTVSQRLIVPKSSGSVTWDKTDETVIDASEKIYLKEATTYAVGVFVSYQRIYSSIQDAADYAAGSDTIFDRDSGIEFGLGQVKYIGNDKHAAIKVKIHSKAAGTSVWTSIATP